jgi:hypothetical protein
VRVTGSISEAEAYIEWLLVRARAQIAQPHTWAGIQAIAAALLEKQRLTYLEAADLWREGISRHFATSSVNLRSRNNR